MRFAVGAGGDKKNPSPTTAALWPGTAVHTQLHVSLSVSLALTPVPADSITVLGDNEVLSGTNVAGGGGWGRGYRDLAFVPNSQSGLKKLGRWDTADPLAKVTWSFNSPLLTHVHTGR